MRVATNFKLCVVRALVISVVGSGPMAVVTYWCLRALNVAVDLMP